MRRLLVISICLFMCAFVGCDTANNIYRPEKNYFVKYYGHDGNQQGVDLVLNADGTMIVLGNSISTDDESTLFVLKVDSKGDVIWEKKFLGPLSSAIDIEPVTNGYVIVANEERGVADGRFTIKLIKISESGELLIESVLDEWESQTARSITPVTDGTFLITGQTSPEANLDDQTGTGNEAHDFFVARFDSNLSNPDPRAIGVDLNGTGVKVLETATGDFYYFGDSDKVDNNGVYQFNFYYAGFSNNDFINIGSQNFQSNATVSLPKRLADVQPVPLQLGDGYVLLGTMTGAGTASDFYVEKMKKTINFSQAQAAQNFELQQRIPLGQAVQAVSIAPSLSVPQGYLLLGNVLEGTNVDHDMLLVKIGFDGQVYWQSSFGAKGNNDLGGVVKELPDGKIVIIGTMNLGTEEKIALIKINRNGDFLN